MIYKIRITSKSQKDPIGNALLSEIKNTLKISGIVNIRTAKVYRLEGLSENDTKRFAKTVLDEPLTHTLSFEKPVFIGHSYLIEVGYKPGVMNPEVASLLKSSKDLGSNLKAADSSTEYAFWGKVAKKDMKKIQKNLLVNDTIEHVVNKTPKTLIISGKAGSTKIIPIRKMSEKQLIDLAKKDLFLNLLEMKIIQNYFIKLKRDPTDCELEILAQTWSEHCVHKTFKSQLVVDGVEKEPLFKRIKDTAKNKKIVVSAFVDNSGVIDFYDGFAINGKVETHNSPAAIEPYGAAMTGSGGVFRDILGTGQGAKPIVSTDIFCFASPDLPHTDVPPGCLSPNYILRKIVAGVRDYGNRVGIPTNDGSIHFHSDFRAKPTVAVGAYGIIPKKYALKKEPKASDLILTVGGATGRDGIHGATFSSGEMTAQTLEKSGASVQIGNAIEEKRVLDLILTLRDKNLIRTITDCGAGGYSSAVGEMAQDIGAIVELEKVPLKYPGLTPWEIFLSESQERMVIAVAPKDLKKIQQIAKVYNVRIEAIGKFEKTNKLKVTYKKQIIANLDMDFLHSGIPLPKLVGKSKKRNASEKLPTFPQDLEKMWQKVMAHGNVCSKENIVRLYDHNVQGTSALHPFSGVNYDGPNDGSIVTPILGKKYGLAITHGLNPILNSIDPKKGAVWALIEAVSNYVAIGGEIENAALIDNFIWPFPDSESLADLDIAIDAICTAAKTLNMPFISGKDSLSSTYKYPDGKVLKIPPVVLISVFGKIPNIEKTQTSDIKKIGSTLVLVGRPDWQSLGGSVYYQLTGATSAKIPTIDLKETIEVFKSINIGIKNKKILACHDISEGGLAAAIAEMCFGGNCGADINIVQFNTRADSVLFNETAGTFIVEVENEKTAKNLFTKVPYAIIGYTKKGNDINKISVSQLKAHWQQPMKEIFP